MSYQESIRFDWSSRRSAEGLRMRYRPSSRINQTLFSMIPWINVIVLVAAVVATLGSYVVIPGVTVTLTQAPFTDGFRTDLVLLVMPDAAPRNGKEQKVQVYFQDEGFKISDAQQRERFRHAINKTLENRKDKEALLYVDASVEQAGLVHVMDVLRDTDMGRVNVVVRP